jgi:hypothetical protein
MGADAARRKIAAGKFIRGDEGEYPCIDARPQGLNRVPHERIATVFVAVQKADLKRQTKPRARASQSSGFDNDAIVYHR